MLTTRKFKLQIRMFSFDLEMLFSSFYWKMLKIFRCAFFALNFSPIHERSNVKK